MSEGVVIVAGVAAYLATAVAWGLVALRTLGGRDLIGPACVGLLWPISVPVGATAMGIALTLRMVGR